MTHSEANRKERVPPRAMLVAGLAGIALLGGCTNHAPRPDRLSAEARDALNHGQDKRAVALAEAAVAADGRNAALRQLLADAYLRGGRFESARQTYADAIDLGDDSARAALGMVLADLALAHNDAAIDTLNTYGDALNPADLGLALVMAGQNDRGLDVLIGAVRDGNTAPKLRQNLAYAYALSGRWNEARLMVGQVLPADQVDARLQSWAAMARPEDARRRVASLLGSPLVGDPGQPQALALAHFPAPAPAKPVQAASAVGAAPVVQAPVAADGALARIDLPPAPPVEPQAPKPVPAPVAAPAVVAPVRAAVPPARKAVAAAVVHPRARPAGTHVVQLGAFSSRDGAQRAWHHFVKRNPALSAHQQTITQVNLGGHALWRLQAAGFVARAPAISLCGTLKAHGGSCLVMAANVAARVVPVQTASARPVAQPARPSAKPAPKPAR